MLRELIIADRHNRFHAVEEVLCRLRGYYDRAIVLGDYFDYYHDTPAQAETTARWLLSSTQHSDRVHLIGNHDLPYLFPCRANPHHGCPGWTEAKHDRVRQIFDSVPCERVFKIAHASDNWLFTHAGLSYDKAAFPAKLMYGDITALGIADMMNAEVAALAAGKAPGWITTPGKRMDSRDGPGGVFWVDWADLVPIPGIMQCVGHTSRMGVRFKSRDGGTAVCLDAVPAQVLLRVADGDPLKVNDFAVMSLNPLVNNLRDENPDLVQATLSEVASTFNSFMETSKPEAAK